MTRSSPAVGLLGEILKFKLCKTQVHLWGIITDLERMKIEGVVR